MAFISETYTNAGLTLINDSIGGEGAVTITSVQVGSGFPALSDDPRTYTGLKNSVKTLTAITSPSNLSGITSINDLVLYQTTVRFQVSTQDAPGTYQFNEYGIWAKVGSNAPVMIVYVTTGSATGDTITPSGGGTPIVKQNATIISYSQSVSSTTSLSLTNTVDLHAGTHLDNGTDPLPVATTSRTGSLTRLSGIAGTYLDGAAGTWIQVIPSGVLWDFGGSSAPTGWLLCDGSAISRTTYSALFGAIGTAYGVGNGTTTFNVPDFRGRVAVGAGAGVNLTSRSLGASGGEETHMLLLTELASHSHTVIEGSGHAHTIPAVTHTHTIPATTHTHAIPANSHNHGLTQTAHSHHVSILATYAGFSFSGGSATGVAQVNPGVGGTDNSTVAGHPADLANAGIGILASSIGISAVTAAGIGISAVNSASTGLTVTDTDVTGITNANAGGNASHNNMPPYLVATKIIKI